MTVDILGSTIISNFIVITPITLNYRFRQGVILQFKEKISGLKSFTKD